MTLPRFALALFPALALLAACDRPFVDVARPSFRILSPDTSEAISADRVLVRVEPTSFRGVDTVRAAGKLLTPVGGGAAFEGSVTLQPGANLIPLEAVDAGGVVGRDTLRLLSLRSGTTVGPVLLEPRADHAAVVLGNGDLLVMGGVAARGAAASDAVFILRQSRQTFERLQGRLVAARSGHTATLLPDGKVLVVGGTRREGSRDLADLVETVEIFDPIAERFTLLPVQGAQVRNVQHVAFLVPFGTETRLHVLAGEGDVSYGSPRYAVRSDLRRFTVLTDRLVALGPGATDGQGTAYEPLEGHSALTLTNVASGNTSTPTRVFVAGVRPGTAPFVPASFELRTASTDVREVVAAAPVIPRTHHAAAPIALDYGFLAGGLRSPTEATARAEIYSIRARRYFLVPVVDFLESRLDASATFHGNGRIRLVGGFNPSGTALATTLLYTATL